MPSNRGKTSLKRKRRAGNSMQDFDRLPTELRSWLASAVLPWRPKSVQRTYSKALARTQCADRALQQLDELQMRLIAKDARKVWGENHPQTMTDNAS